MPQKYTRTLTIFCEILHSLCNDSSLVLGVQVWVHGGVLPVIYNWKGKMKSIVNCMKTVLSTYTLTLGQECGICYLERLWDPDRSCQCWGWEGWCVVPYWPGPSDGPPHLSPQSAGPVAWVNHIIYITYSTKTLLIFNNKLRSVSTNKMDTNGQYDNDYNSPNSSYHVDSSLEEVGGVHDAL